MPETPIAIALSAGLLVGLLVSQNRHPEAVTLQTEAVSDG